MVYHSLCSHVALYYISPNKMMKKKAGVVSAEGNEDDPVDTLKEMVLDWVGGPVDGNLYRLGQMTAKVDGTDFER